MSLKELHAAFQAKRNSLRNATLGDDTTISRSGFIDTSSGAVVTSAKALELARHKRDVDLEKHSIQRAKEARRTTKRDCRLRVIAEHARQYHRARTKRCAALAAKRLEEFTASVRSFEELHAVGRMRTQLRRS